MDKEISGYIHNVSPIGQGESKRYFDFHLQTKDNVIRAVCFSPGKRKTFEEAELQKSPIKIRRFINDKKFDSTDIMMNDKVIIEDIEDIDYERKDLGAKGVQIVKLPSLMLEQMIHLKAKVINLQTPRRVRENTDNPLTKREALLLDPTGTDKVVLWESDVDLVENNKTYSFKNLCLKKNRFNGDIYVNPAKGCSMITLTEDFPADSLQPPQAIPPELVTSTVTGEVVAVQRCVLNFCCLKCSCSIQSPKQTVIVCNNCQLKQKFSKCKKQWFVSAIIDDGKRNVTGNLYHEMVQKVLELADNDKKSTDDEEVVSEIFFTLPSLTCTFNERTKTVESVSIQDSGSESN